MKTTLNEYLMNDSYFLIVYHAGGDETHFLLMDMKHYEKVSSVVEEMGNRRVSMDEVNDFTEYCFDNVTEVMKTGSGNFWLQTYCDEKWPFNDYKIERILSIPEFS